MPEAVNIRVVNLAPILGPFHQVSERDYEAVAVELGKAMGFAYLVNHGVDLKKIEDIYKKSREFFTLPMKVKRQYTKPNPAKSFHGYAGPGDELLNEAEKNSTELRELWDIWGQDAHQEDKWPKETPLWKGTFDAIRPELNNAAKKLLKCLEKHLKLEPNHFIDRHRNLDDYSIKTQTQFRSMYYYTLNPDAIFPPNAIRCGEHSDWGSITMLFQDMTGGLEVKTAQGEWVEAAPLEGSILLNSGQLIEVWSGGHLHAAPHRVRILDTGLMTKIPRQSFIHFVNPDGNTLVSPKLPLKKGKEHFAERPALVAYDHYQRLIEHSYNKGY